MEGGWKVPQFGSRPSFPDHRNHFCDLAVYGAEKKDCFNVATVSVVGSLVRHMTRTEDSGRGISNEFNSPLYRDLHNVSARHIATFALVDTRHLLDVGTRIPVLEREKGMIDRCAVDIPQQISAFDHRRCLWAPANRRRKPALYCLQSLFERLTIHNDRFDGFAANLRHH